MLKQDYSTAEESLSGLMDGELSELELRRLLKRLQDDEEMTHTWSRYHLIGAGLRGDLPHALATPSFAASVSAAIADEDVHATSALSANKPKAVGWFNQLGRAAVAASVAGLVVVGVQQYNAEETVANAVATTVAPKAQHVDLPSGINAPALSARTVAIQSGYDSRPQESRRVLFVPRQDSAPVYNEDVSVYVNNLIEEHSGNAAANTHQGMLPFTRIILIDEE